MCIGKLLKRLKQIYFNNYIYSYIKLKTWTDNIKFFISMVLQNKVNIEWVYLL